MTIASSTAKSGPYNGNGSTTVFAYGFKVFDEADLVVTLLNSVGTEVVQTLTTHYTVSGVGSPSGGSITMVTAPATGEKLVITRAVPFLQELDLQNRKAVNPELIERSLDLLTQMLQDINERVERSLKIDVFETVNLDTLLANVNAIASLSSELSAVAAITTEIVSVAGDAADIGTVAALDTEIAALGALVTELQALYAIRANITTVAGISADVTTVAGISAAVSALAAIETALTNLNAIRTNITSVDGNSANINTVAGIAADVTTTAGIAADVTAVAAIDVDVTAVAAVDTAVTSIAQKYQGASATDPTVRALDGSALQVGDFYLNTVSGDIRFVTSTGPVVWSELTTLIDETTLDTMGVTVTAAEINIGSQALENKIINGAFDIWQRGTSTTVNGYGAADRWANTFTGGTVTQSRQAFDIDAAFGQNRPEFRLRQAVTGQTLAGHYALTQQSIEDVRSYNGNTITVLGFARRHSGAGNMGVEMVQVFGSGGSPSAPVTGIGSQQVALTTDWEPFAAVISVPTVTGKTLGTTGDDYLALHFWSSAGSDYDARTASLGLQTVEVELWGVHVRVGTFDASAAFDYVQPNLADEFVRCQRYYQTGRSLAYGAHGATFRIGTGFPLPTTMRAAPTAALGIVSSSSYNSGLAVAFNTANSLGWTAVMNAAVDASITVSHTLDAEL